MYYDAFACAYVRGEAIKARENGGKIVSLDEEIRGRALSLAEELLQTPLAALTDAQTQHILAEGKAAGLKLYRFKRTLDELARVKRTIGVLKALQPETLLDVGTGRGAFLWPCMHALTQLRVSCVDLLPRRVETLEKVALGGVTRLSAEAGDFTRLARAPKSADVVTLLEVLEHIPDAAAAARAAVKFAKKYVVATVPSKPDENPEHIHLFTPDALCKMFENAGARNTHIDFVPGHIVATVTLEANA